MVTRRLQSRKKHIIIGFDILMVYLGLVSRSSAFTAHIRALSSSAYTSSSFGGSLWKCSYQKRQYSRSTSITMMPEGPEVRTLVDQLQDGAIGCRLVDIQFLSGRYVRHGRPKGFEDFAATMTPWFSSTSANSESPPTNLDVVTNWDAKGKFIYIELDEGADPPAYCKGGYQRSIWITLGMSGKFVSESVHLEDPGFARWVLELLDLQTKKLTKIYYHDQRNFGTLRFCLSREELQEKLDSLGPDILEPDTTDVNLFLAIVDRQRPQLNICKFLMDQSKIAGIGNYILSECLYRSKIDPFASLSEISEDQLRHLFHEAQTVAIESYKAQGLTRTGGSYRNVDGEKGKFEFQLQCYGRQVCANGKPVIRDVDGPHKRTIWYVEDQLFKPLQSRRGEMTTIKNEKKQTSTLNTSTHDENDYSNIQLTSAIHDEGWKDALSEILASDSFENLQKFLAQESNDGQTIYPPVADLFTSLNLCPFDKVKVVIVGQDPYHGPGQGHGLAFSVREGVRPPPSLKNIVREAMDDLPIEEPRHGNLACWARQGVLLINTVMTVRRGEANSHKGQGWEEFTDKVIEALNERKDDGIVFLLWGNPAAKKAACVDESRHVVIRTSHPSPLGATKTNSPFLGSRCFSRTNKALESMEQTPIDWSIQ